MASFSAAEQPAMQNGTMIIVGGNSNYPPYEFLDKNGDPAGFNIDLTRAVAKVMGMNVQIQLGTYRERIQALKDGKIDAMGGFSYSDERARSFDFSPPHTIINLAIFGRKDSPPLKSMSDLKGKKILVMAGGRMQELLREKGLGENRIFIANYADGLRMLAAGEYDYMFMGTLPGMYLINEYNLSNIIVLKEVDHQRYCFAVRKGNRELLARFSEGLAIVKKTSQYNAIYDKWLGVLEPRGVAWAKVVKIGSIATTLFTGALLLALFWSRTLSKRVDERTAALSQEISQRKRIEEELRSSQEQMLQAEKLAAIGTLVSGVAHEINNPNGLILMNAQMLKEMNEDIRKMAEERYRNEGDFKIGKWYYSEVRENLSQMLAETVEASKKIVRIVDDLKNFSRRAEPALNEEVDLNSVAMSALRLLDVSIRKATDSFTVHYAENLPLFRGNAQRIEQVVVNLVLNACQALSGREKRIELTTRYDSEHKAAVLEVKDEGVGINPQGLRYVTDPFYTTRREMGGTGLGLSVSSTIVKEHKGILAFSSEEGKGTVVTVSFPVHEKES